MNLSKLTQPIHDIWQKLGPIQRVLVIMIGTALFLTFVQIITGAAQQQIELRDARIQDQFGRLSEQDNFPVNRQTMRVLDQLPYEGDIFLIQYLSVSNIFMITVTEPPYETAVAAGYSWLNNQGISEPEFNIEVAYSRFQPD